MAQAKSQHNRRDSLRRREKAWPTRAIEVAGGITRVARALNADRRTVERWSMIGLGKMPYNRAEQLSELSALPWPR
jgi:hypothetical protein